MDVTVEQPHRRWRTGADNGSTLVIILILAVLAAIVAIGVRNLPSASATASCGTDLKTVEYAVEFYKAQEGVYPTAATGGTVIANEEASSFDTYGTTNGIFALLHTDNASAAAGGEATGPYEGTGKGSLTNPVGPSLKDIPINPGHYEITVSTDGRGTVGVIRAPSGIAPAETVTGIGAVRAGAGTTNCTNVG